MRPPARNHKPASRPDVPLPETPEMTPSAEDDRGRDASTPVSVVVHELTTEELRLLRQRVERLEDVARAEREALANCLRAASRPDDALSLARKEAGGWSR